METHATCGTYPEMSPLLLETVMRLTIDKVKTQRSPPPPPPPPTSQSQSPRLSATGEELSRKTIPFTRSKSTSLLRTLLILQIGRKTSRLLSLLSQQDLCQSGESVQEAPSQLPQTSSPSEEPLRNHGGKRRSPDVEEVETEGSGAAQREQPTSSEGPSCEKTPCLEQINRAYVISSSSADESPIRGLHQLSLQSPVGTNSPYGEDSCPGCQRCSMWMQQQQPLNAEASKFQICEPVRQC